MRRTDVVFTCSLATGLTLLCHAGAASAQSQRAATSMSVVERESSQDKGDAKTFEVRVDNGKVTVKQNGKEVSGAHISTDGGRVVITDAEGNELKAFELHIDDGVAGFAHDWSGYEWGGQYADAIAALHAEPPTVMLGVIMVEPPPALEYHMGLEPGAATMISAVYEGLPAYEAGLRQYDVIVKVEGQSPAGSDAIKQALAKKAADDTIELHVIHKGETKAFPIKLKKYDRKALDKARVHGEDEHMTLFKQMEPLNNLDRAQLHAHLTGIVRGEHLQFVAPQLEEEARQLLKAKAAAGDNADLKEKLDRLDQRMADLEKMLQKLLEQR